MKAPKKTVSTAKKTQEPVPSRRKRRRDWFKYFSSIWEGNDGKVSGKRVSGIILTAFGIHIANYGVKNCMDRIDAIIGLVAAIFGTALAFWGITAVANYFHEKTGPFPPEED